MVWSAVGKACGSNGAGTVFATAVSMGGGSPILCLWTMQLLLWVSLELLCCCLGRGTGARGLLVDHEYRMHGCSTAIHLMSHRLAGWPQRGMLPPKEFCASKQPCCCLGHDRGNGAWSCWCGCSCWCVCWCCGRLGGGGVKDV